MYIPEVTTERLRLRGLEARDFEAYAAMMADPEVTRHLGDGQPLSRFDAWRIISLIRPDNAASIAVARALGAVPAGEVDFFGAPTLVYEYPSPAGEPQR
ncbi:MAG TPA: GNAT family N-acetyltransferase [Longimicrobium sp.]|nr:GNAT family N-acetyltransferase [Longimicrobium sp.]